MRHRSVDFLPGGIGRYHTGRERLMRDPRRRNEPRTAFTVRLPVSLHRRLKDHANRTDVPMSRLVMRSLRELLDRREASHA